MTPLLIWVLGSKLWLLGIAYISCDNVLSSEGTLLCLQRPLTEVAYAIDT